jgi:hypothetical protein
MEEKELVLEFAEQRITKKTKKERKERKAMHN